MTDADAVKGFLFYIAGVLTLIMFLLAWIGGKLSAYVSLWIKERNR